jgi:hypothetical protein
MLMVDESQESDNPQQSEGELSLPFLGAVSF